MSDKSLTDALSVAFQEALDACADSLGSCKQFTPTASRLSAVALQAIERAGYKIVPANTDSKPPARKVSDNPAWRHFAALNGFDPDDFGSAVTKEQER